MYDKNLRYILEFRRSEQAIEVVRSLKLRYQVPLESLRKVRVKQNRLAGRKHMLLRIMTLTEHKRRVEELRYVAVWQIEL